MNSLSTTSKLDSSKKTRNRNRTRVKINRKIIAFEELTQDSTEEHSARHAAQLLGVANSTIQSWRSKKNIINEEKHDELAAFLHTDAGAEFLQRNVMAVTKAMKCGSSGIRGIKEYLKNSGLDRFVASSEGALQKFWVRCEEHILSFGKEQEAKLVAKMKRRKITVGLDEMFRGKKPCLVAIEVVSNYILLEKFTENRTASTWKKHLDERTKDLNVEIEQVVSDLAGAIQSCAKKLGAEHIPELFHAQHEISKATGAALSSQVISKQKELQKLEEKIKKIESKPRRIEKEAVKKHKQQLLKLQYLKVKVKAELRKRLERQETVREAKRELGNIHHPIDLKTGRLKTSRKIIKGFNKELKTIRESAKDAGLSTASRDRIEKGQRAFNKIGIWLFYFFTIFLLHVKDLDLNLKEKKFFNSVVFPLVYYRMIWRRLKPVERAKYQKIVNILEIRMRDAPWPENRKKELMKKGKEIAERFQRSSSCVEGRNGFLSLNYHRFHRLGPRSLRVLSIVHNFDSRREDGTTAAERFFQSEHDNLFESLVENVRIPGKPQKQKHRSTNRRSKKVA